jgi:NADH-quinone oxidoreductase subunit L
LIHFWLHAFLRTYQFLISPSVVTYFIKNPVGHRSSFGGRFSGTPWVRRLAVGEFFLEEFFETMIVKPIITLGSSWRYLTIFSLITYIAIKFISPDLLSPEALILSIAVSLRALSIKESAYAVAFVIISAMGLLFSGSVMHWSSDSIIACSLGILPGILFWVTKNQIAMFVGWLCLAGFPLSPYFIGEDLLLHGLAREGLLPTLIFCLTFIINGIVLCRAYIMDTWLKTARPLD